MSIQFDKVQPKNKAQLKQLINYAFKHNIYDLNFIDTSEITDMSKIFMSCEYDIDVSSWDVSNVTTTFRMFVGCKKFNSNLSNWNMANVKTARYMFSGCENFEGKGLENWDVSKVKDMHSMFAFCNKFDCDLSHWNVSKVKDMTSMFNGCKNFNCNLSRWNMSKVRNISYMFYNCTSFKGEGLYMWDVSNIYDAIKTFKGCNKLTIPNWYK